MTDMDQFKVMADQLWLYLEPKVKALMSSNVKFFRAQVVSNPGDGTLEVRKPFETGTITLPCTTAISSAAVGSQVIVFVLGNLSNAVVVSDGKMTEL